MGCQRDRKRGVLYDAKRDVSYRSCSMVSRRDVRLLCFYCVTVVCHVQYSSDPMYSKREFPHIEKRLCATNLWDDVERTRHPRGPPTRWSSSTKLQHFSRNISHRINRFYCRCRSLHEKKACGSQWHQALLPVAYDRPRSKNSSHLGSHVP
jgi:hypothetical protein